MVNTLEKTGCARSPKALNPPARATALTPSTGSHGAHPHAQHGGPGVSVPAWAP